VVYDGQYSVEPSVLEPERIDAYVPSDVTLFPGRHAINVVVTDATGTRNIGPAYFTVLSEATGGPPQLSYPEIVVAEWLSANGTPVTFTVTAMSSDGTPLPATCSPASGSLFPRGETTVHCSATDLNGTTEAEFVVVVTDTTPPVITAPSRIESDTAIVSYTVSATDNLDGSVPVTCTPESGSTFRAGTTLVSCVAFDSYLNPGYAYIEVIVTGGPPALTLPDPIVTQQKIVTYAVTATGEATITCTPASGSTFPIGVTTVNCTATNAFGSDSGSFTVEVYDATPPVLSLVDITTAATSPDGAIVTFNPTATDAETGPAAVACSPESGSLFPIGTTLVVCTATDGYGNAGFGTFTVTVNDGDTTPPVLTLTDVTAEATSPAGATVTYTATAFDNVDGTITPTCSPASGSTFALGVTTVQCSATDAAGNTATGSFTVTVSDTTAPTIVAISATPTNLWPANHQMVLVTVSATVIDSVDDAPITRIISVKSNRPLNGTGDGDIAPDWNILGPMQLELRSERSSGIDRKYTITVESVDASGNTTTATVEVTVSQTRRRAA
jgi:large repetitive protein